MARRLDPSDLEKAACSGDVEKVMKLLDMSSTGLSENQDNPTVKPHVRNEDVQTAFLLAIDRNHVGAIQTLVLAGADVNSQGTGLSFNMPPLMYALYLNRVTCVGELLKLGADMNSMDNEGRNALMLAAMYEGDQCLKLLINAGANVNFQNKEIHFDEDYIGRTVLMYAAEYHKVNLLKMLLEAGADVNVKTPQGLTALHWAVKCYTACDTVSTCIRILLDHGADCNAETSDGETALMVMVRNHKPAHECVKLLIDSGTDVNKGNLKGNTVLMIAVRDDDLVTLLPILVKAGAVINQQDSDGETALAHAVKYRSCECVRWLLDSGADVTTVDNEGKTVLMHAAKSSFGVHHLPVVGKFGAAFHQQDSKGKIAQEDAIKHKLKLCVGWLIDSGADVTKTDIKGRNVLMYAAEKSYMGHLLPIFVKPGAAIDQQDSSGMTALSHAASTGSHECVRWLLGAGASVNICDNSGMSPLVHASKYGSHQCVRLLVDSGADVNIRDHLGKSPLHFIFSLDKNNADAEQCLRILLSKEPDVNAKDNEGMTPLMYVVRKPDIRTADTMAYNIPDTMAILLLDHGVEVNLVDNLGRTALCHCLQAFLEADIHLQHEQHTRRHPYLLMGYIDPADNIHFLIDYGGKVGTGKFRVKKLSRLIEIELDLDLDLDLLNTEVEDDVDLNVQWEKFVSVIIEGRRKLLQFLIINKVMPSLPPLGLNFNVCYDSFDAPSVLENALRYGKIGVTKYLIATCYVHNNDLTFFSTRQSDIEESNNPEVVTIMENLRSQPWPLVKLCFVAVSTVFGASPGRQERVKNSQLPVQIQTMLLFQEPWSRLCVHQWDEIPLTFSPENYEKLPRPRPLLYQWPVGRELVPCDCGECDGTMYKYELEEEDDEND